MWAWGESRRRAALAIVGLTLALGMGTIALHSARGDVPPLEYSAEQLVLRLHDLPPGYYMFNSSEDAGREFLCEPLQPGEPGHRLKRFVESFSPAGCVGIYFRAYRVPGTGPTSAVVGTGAMDVGSDAAAALGFDLSGRLLDKAVDPDLLEEVAPPATIGTATRLFHWKDVPHIFRNGLKASFVAWRSDTVLAATFATAGSLATSDRIALDLAHRQQAHIENPTPYTAAERYATEVELDNPALDFPVYWLGRNFEPGHGLRNAQLIEASANAGTRRTTQKLHLAYTPGIYLDAWTQEGWKSSPDGMPRWTWRCTESQELELPQGGRATVYASYEKNLDECPKHPPRQYSALVHIGGMTIVVGRGVCPVCLGNAPAPGPYNSLKGMKAIVRGLQLRPKPVYPVARR